jgi:hypothetical protein
MQLFFAQSGSVNWVSASPTVKRPPWEIRPDEVVDVDLSAEERELLWQGLHQWGGPTRPTDAIASVIGFPSVDAMHVEKKPIMERLRAGQPLSKRDWERALVAIEIVFASSYYGAAGDWEIVSTWDDDRTLRVLRGIQRKLAGFRARPRRGTSHRGGREG